MSKCAGDMPGSVLGTGKAPRNLVRLVLPEFPDKQTGIELLTDYLRSQQSSESFRLQSYRVRYALHLCNQLFSAICCCCEAIQSSNAKGYGLLKFAYASSGETGLGMVTWDSRKGCRLRYACMHGVVSAYLTLPYCSLRAPCLWDRVHFDNCLCLSVGLHLRMLAADHLLTCSPRRLSLRALHYC